MKTQWANCAAPIIRLPISTLDEKDAVLMENWEIFDVCGFRFVVPAGASIIGGLIVSGLAWLVKMLTGQN